MSDGDLDQVDGEVRITCALIEATETDNGWLLDLAGTSSDTIHAYCREEVMPQPPPVGTLLRIIGEVVHDPEPFLFVKTAVIVQQERYKCLLHQTP